MRLWLPTKPAWKNERLPGMWPPVCNSGGACCVGVVWRAITFYLMGKCYMKGVGCSKDPEGAVSCLENAARRGHATAALKLGACFEQGVGAPQSDELAAYWYRKAAARGESCAYDELLRLGRKTGMQKGKEEA